MAILVCLTNVGLLFFLNILLFSVEQFLVHFFLIYFSYSTGGQKEINLYGKERAWEKVTVRTLQERKKKNVKITCISITLSYSFNLSSSTSFFSLLSFLN